MRRFQLVLSLHFIHLQPANRPAYKSLALFIFFILFILPVSNAQTVTVSPSDKNLSYEGRIGFPNKEEAAIYWPGSWVTVNFMGTGAKAMLKDASGENYFYIIIDKQKEGFVKIKLDTAKKIYQLASNLPYGKHSVQLFKLTNPTRATTFFGFTIEGNAKLLKPDKKPQRKIEFFGNSITVGHGVEVSDPAQDSGDEKYFNNYLSYAAITARYFNAQYHCTARSGIGLMLSWFPEIMPETYGRLDPYDSTSKWDFKKYTPDVVVINLLQNDYWLINMPNHTEFKHRFGTKKPDSIFIIQAYQSFLQQVRSKYPKATIICTLGSMNATEDGSSFPRYIVSAIKGMYDKKILHHFYPFKKTPGHPKIKEQQAMADSLINFIETNIRW